MTDVEITAALSDLVREKLRYEGPLEGDLADHLDSVQRLTLVVAIEDHFEICFDEEDEAQIMGVGDLVGLIQRKVSAS